MSPHNDAPRGLKRRDLLAGAVTGSAGLGLLWTATRRGLVEPSRAAAVAEAAGASCTLSRELTEGPYWIDTSLTRRDITEDRPGVPLQIVFTVQDARTCRVIPGADVEIWHADAGGDAVHTGQLFFRDALSAAVYRTRHYRDRGAAETTNAADGIYERSSRLAVRRRRGAGFAGRMTLNVATA